MTTKPEPRGAVECPRTPHGLPVALLVNETPSRRGRRLAWAALAAVAVAAPVWSAVRGSARSRGSEAAAVPAARADRAASPARHPEPRAAAAAPDQARSAGAQPSPPLPPPAPTDVAEPLPAPAPTAVAEASPAAPQQVAAPEPARSEPAPTPGAAPSAAPASADEIAHVGLWSATFARPRPLARATEAGAAAEQTPEAARDVQTLSAFLRRATARGALVPVADPVTSVPGMRALALAREGAAALWLLAPRKRWGEPVEDARVAFRGLAPGRWRVTWVDDVSGAEIAVEERDLDGDAEIAAPAFARHVAALLVRLD